MPEETGEHFVADQTGLIDFSGANLTPNLQQNIDLFHQILSGDDTAIFRPVQSAADARIRCCVIFVDGMTDTLVMNESIFQPITVSPPAGPEENLLEFVKDRVIASNEIQESGSVADLVAAILYGDTLVLVEGQTQGIIVNTKGFPLRGVSEPDDEKSLSGPREGFTEGILKNLAMLRRKLQTSDLKIAYQKIGSRTGTKLALCYLNSLADPQVLAEIKARLQKINVDGILDVNQICERIKDHRLSIFKTIGTTEKPDIVAARLLEGRVALFLDGTPMVLTMPYLLVESFQATDDYYLNFHYANIGRRMRLLAFLIATGLPALYVALTAFQQEMLPTSLMLSIAAAAKGVPFPTFAEAFGMLGIFEILQETGLRMPNKFGQALSIVGALVIGQAGVEAKIASAPMVIIVAASGITGLMLPRLKGAVILVRFGCLAAASVIGLYGYYFVMLGVFLYLLSMRSFGRDYTAGFLSFKWQDVKDAYLRAPYRHMKTRPRGMARDFIREKEE